VDRFWSKVDLSNPDGCWNFLGCTAMRGYGNFSMNKTMVAAHRVSYELCVGPILNETVDHLCYNRKCVNPDHLECVSRSENTIRGMAMRPRVIRCKRAGHLYTPENTRTSGAKRWCRECTREGVVRRATQRGK
jgi:hypothetical protein